MLIVQKADRRMGIYQIKCTKNGTAYIGSTVDIYERYSHHRWSLRKGIHHNKQIQKDYNEYGDDCFIFELIEEVSDKDKLSSIEQYYMDCISNKYNILPNAYSTLDYKHSEEVKEEIQKRQMGSGNSFYEKLTQMNIRRILVKEYVVKTILQLGYRKMKYWR